MCVTVDVDTSKSIPISFLVPFPSRLRFQVEMNKRDFVGLKEHLVQLFCCSHGEETFPCRQVSTEAIGPQVVRGSHGPHLYSTFLH